MLLKDMCKEESLGCDNRREMKTGEKALVVLPVTYCRQGIMGKRSWVSKFVFVVCPL